MSSSPPDSSVDRQFFVVGIGASAGGLRALEEFFENMPTDSSAAFVVVQHLSPDFKSLMKELLGRRTSMEIYQVEDGTVLKPNSVYLIPPGKNLVADQQRLRLQQQDRNVHSPNWPIDLFFQSLAQNYIDRAIGVVLSGTGSDGTRGLRAINEAGGIAIAQDPATAEFDGMPKSAIATGIVDRIGSPQELARVIYQFLRSPGDAQPLGSNTSPVLDSLQLQQITTLLNRYEQVDFSHYKLSTLSRRIHRRCSIVGCVHLEDYIRRLQDSEEERKILRNDLLIGVTSFFRDPAAWDFIETNIIPALLEKSQPTEELRFWVTACATGEEAYSLAILLDEAIADLGKPLKVKIFATDIDRVALEKAAQGIYPETIASDVAPDRLERYFVAKDRSFQVVRRLREMLIFAPHDLTKDAGFTRMHLITCRNVLIYMQSPLQQQVLRNLHFSLVPGGILFLGEAETVGDFEDELAPVNSKWKMYQKQRDVRLPLPVRGVDKLSRLPRSQPSSKEFEQSRKERMLESAVSSLLGEQQATCLLVDRDNRLLHLFEDLVGVMRLPTGSPTLDVTQLVAPPLQLPLNTALHRAKKEKCPVLYAGIQLEKGEETRRVNLKVTYHEANKLAGDFLMVTIQEDARPAPPIASERFEADTAVQARLAELEYELQQTRENLQASIEELETTNEEQQATNEELIASNEELQSTNEELHSVNEELYTVNTEYQSKIQELTKLNNDIDNLLRSTDIGVIFLDRDLKIRKFTPAATAAINLVEADIGRPLAHLSHNMNCPDLLGLLSGVIARDRPIEIEVQLLARPIHLLMRVHPYRREDSQTDGVVIAFVNISDLKKFQEQLTLTNHALQESETQLRQVNTDLEERVRERTAQLTRAKTAAEAADRAKSAFIAHMSHELRTPLNSILGLTQILLRDCLPNSEQHRRVDMMYKSGKHLQTLIDDVLYFAKIEAGKLELSWGEFHLPTFADNLLAFVRLRARDKGLALEVQTVSNLPTIVYGDETRLRQVLLNLLSNAIKFTDSGRVVLKIGYVENFAAARSPSNLASNSKIRFQVEDTGTGIAPDQLAAIFLPFYQGSQGSSLKEGTGLGLTISQNILRQMGSEIQVSSTLEEGSRFWFDIDLPEVEKLTEVRPLGLERIIGFKGPPRKILVVDNEANHRSVLASGLSDLGFELFEATNGEEGLSKAAECQPDAILLDLVMPGMNGWELSASVRQHPELKERAIAIVAISATAVPDRQTLCDRAGCDAFLPKPLYFQHLLNVLGDLLGLEWIERERPSPSAVESSEPATPERTRTSPFVLPPRETLQTLCEFVASGDVRGLIAAADQIAQRNPSWEPFARQVRQLSESFQLEKLQQLIQDFIESQA